VRKSAVGELNKMVKSLRDQRQYHLDAVDQIDAAFDGLGMNGQAKTNGHAPGARKPRQRSKFKLTAEEMIAQLLKGKTMTTGQINKRWTRAGRGGNADNTLSKMTRENQIRRTNMPGVMGSQYRLAG